MDHRRTETFFAIVSPGLEEVCARELANLDVASLEVCPGGVAFQGKLADLYRASLWLRSASRVVVRFAEFPSRDFPQLFQRALKLPWGRFLKAETPVQFRVTCRRSRLMHTERVAETFEKAIMRSFGREENPQNDSAQLILVRIVEDRVQVSIDSSGELLHRRGYRRAVTPAPLRETLAAGVLQLAGWDPHQPLCDPMCGSGTFLWEAALLACQQAPGRHRRFAFMRWPGFREGLWRQLCQMADQQQRELGASLAGYDQDAEAIAAARTNGEQLQLLEEVVIVKKSLAEQPVYMTPGLVVCNPPYGLRLETAERIQAFYRDLGRQLHRAFPGWRLAMLCPDAALAKKTGLALRQQALLDNGGLKVGLFVCEKL